MRYSKSVDLDKLLDTIKERNEATLNDIHEYLKTIAPDDPQWEVVYQIHKDIKRVMDEHKHTLSLYKGRV